MATNDLDLLREFKRKNSQDAFAELVKRHLNLVYSAALRQVRSPQLAEEVAQSTFTDLARNAQRLAPNTILTAWLYQVSHRTAIDVVRREARRQLREQIATEMNAMNATASDWTHIEPLLDEAMHALDETDRAAVLLRYFENKSLREVGETLGTSDDAAQKRVSRAVERLREFFAKGGVTVGASGLVVVISTNAVHAAPIGLAVTISTAAAFAGTITSATVATHATMNFMTLKFAALMATAAIAAGTGTYFVQQNSANLLRSENQNLIAAQEKLTGERDAALSAAAAASNQSELSQKDKSDLLRLRSEVGLLRKQTNELQRLQQENHQLQASLAKAAQSAQPPEPNPEDDPQRKTAIAKLNDARQLWLGLITFAAYNQGRLPADLDQLSNHLPDPQGNPFELVAQGLVSGITNPSVIVVREKQATQVNGAWSKAYGFADGHAEYKREPSEGFDAWEKQHILPPP